jgi:hypothetical protein
LVLNSKKEEIVVSGGLVSDEDAAKAIAEIIWSSHFGDRIKKNKPFVAELKDSVWIVKGTLGGGLPGAPRLIGGVPYLEINSKDCKILNLYHTK